ncbi:protein TsetseEP-like [Arachis ipaensis]|uniref:protein TsetseEP-like n=1 Tax=Arachis ipaensis TaxID=130454 RepID=UPI0007AF1A00|nr:protein TsetseEP-like [Arachis ipaensis]
MELHGEEEELKQEAQQEEKIGISEQKEVVGGCLGHVEYIKESQVEEPPSKECGENIKETSNIARVNNELKEIDREVDSITSDFLPTSINFLDDPVEPFSSTLESKVEEDLQPPRPNASEELEEPPTSRRSRARAVAEAARPSSSIAAPAPPSAPELTYLLVQHLLRFMERFEHRVMRRLDRLDQAAASQGIELPPLPESPTSDEQDLEEEHGEEPIQQEAPPEMQNTTPEVQHDIPEPQPVPPPVPPPEPEHEPQPGAIVDPHSELP